METNFHEKGSVEKVKVLSFAHHRMAEMVTLLEAVKTQSGTKRVFQRLPPSMRRRAMSHNVKRVPRQLREIYQREIEKHEKKNLSKRPSRKHRRRPKNLLEEYNRRKRDHTWLETHIWHAKRFHMTDRWNYKIAESSTEKGVRSTYRAIENHCFIQDISYYSCIELNGEEANLLNGLTRLTDPNTGLSFGAKQNLEGKCEGRVFLYHHDSSPLKAIAPTSFMWKCRSSKGESKMRQLWIWTHPSVFETVVSELCIVFRLSKTKENLSPPEEESEIAAKKQKTLNESTEKIVKLKVEERKEEEHETLFKVADCIEYSSKKVRLLILKDKLNRFRLSGSGSTVVLQKALKCASVKCVCNEDEGYIDEIASKITRGKVEMVSSSDWWVRYFENKNTSEIEEQQQIWQKVDQFWNGSILPSGWILGLIARDPRVIMPPKKLKINSTMLVTEPNEMETLYLSSSCRTSYSPLWEEDVRNDVTIKRINESYINQFRSFMNLVPGSEIKLGKREARIPLLLIHNTGSYTQRLGYGHGWDVILPAGWGMAFWVAFLYNGARAGGLQDARQMNLEQGRLFFPNDYPDTEAGKSLDQICGKESTEAYFRHPPAKRVNYTALGIVAPFHYPWAVLTKDWLNDVKKPLESMESDFCNNYSVLRDRKLLKRLQNLLSSSTCLNLEESDEMGEKIKEPILIAISLQMSRGVLHPHDIICLPSREDLEHLTNDKRFHGPVEPCHNVQHLIKENKERRKMIKQRKKLRQKIKSLAAKTEAKEMVTLLEAELQSLNPLPENLLKVINVRNSCSREVMGFVTNGGFAFSIGKTVGSGFCSLASILNLIKLKSKLVLVRNTLSLQYRFASVSVI